MPFPFFFQEVLDYFYSFIYDVRNCSLETEIFPDALKTAAVKPILKKHNVNPYVLSNFRPISNLPILGKILQKAT